MIYDLSVERPNSFTSGFQSSGFSPKSNNKVMKHVYEVDIIAVSSCQYINNLLGSSKITCIKTKLKGSADSRHYHITGAWQGSITIDTDTG